MRKSLAPIGFVLVLALLGACEPSGTKDANSKKPVHCTVIVDGPKKYEGTSVITGRVRYRCGYPGAEVLTLKIRIEKAAAGGGWSSSTKWTPVTSKTFAIRGKDTYAAELKYADRSVTASCSTGSFRTVVDWTRTSHGDKEGDNLISGAVGDPCKAPLFG